MQPLPLTGGAFSARSVIANAQRCVNLYPEPNRSDSPSKFTHYQRPGLVPLVAPGSPGLGRGLYQASNGDGYVVIANELYYISPSWVLFSLGSVAGFASSNGTNICSMVDNGLELIVVDGLPFAGNAYGYIDFTANPTAGDTATFNGVLFTFITGATSGNNIHIGSSVGITIAVNLLTVMSASVDPLLTGAVYSSADDSGSGALLQVLAKAPGTIGTQYTLAASAATRSGATLQLNLGNPVGGGWTLTLGAIATNSLSPISDPAWTGADRVDFLDTFIVWNIPGTRNFGSTLSDQIVSLDPTYVAGKTSWPDNIQSIIVNREQIFLAGTLKSELWYNSGSALFPFARLPGTSNEHGVLARYSLASADLNIYFLSRDLQGNAIVLRLRSNEMKRISNYGLEYQLQQLEAAGVDITDAVGYTYQTNGHLFYVLSFPAGDQTWVWDESVSDPQEGWHQRGWTDGAGVLHRDRGVLGVSLYGKNVVLDWENGTLYEQTTNAWTDTVNGIDCPITYLRTFPHLVIGNDPKAGGYQPANGQMIQHYRFAIDAELGNAPAGFKPMFSLRWSDTRGKSWGNPVLLEAGQPGQYEARPDVRSLGSAMDRVYELSWNFPGQVALNGAWIDSAVQNQ